jgi:hypothetical protein
VDINGAKALKERLGQDGADEAPRTSAEVDIAEDAPPVYHWLGVSQPATEAPVAAEDDPVTQGSTMFRRIGLSFR